MQNLSGGPEWYNSLSQSKQHEIIINLQKYKKQEFIQKYVNEYEIEPEEVVAFLSWWKKGNTNVTSCLCRFPTYLSCDFSLIN